MGSDRDVVSSQRYEVQQESISGIRGCHECHTQVGSLPLRVVRKRQRVTLPSSLVYSPQPGILDTRFPQNPQGFKPPPACENPVAVHTAGR